MALSQSDAKFLQKRRHLVESWKFVGIPLILLSVGLCVFLWLESPLLINPFHVVQQIEQGSLPHATILLAAVILPIMTLSNVVLLGTIILIVFRSFARERRFITIIDRFLRVEKKRGTDVDRAPPMPD